MTLTEAAALLGTTTQTLRRRIQRDGIQTRRDSRGRLRVIPMLGVRNEMVEDPTDAQITVARLFDELKRVRQDLAQAVARQDALMQELNTAREALIWAQDELSAQSLRGLQSGIQKWSLGEGADIDGMKRQRIHLASKLDAARKLAGRRSWHDMPVIGGRVD